MSTNAEQATSMSVKAHNSIDSIETQAFAQLGEWVGKETVLQHNDCSRLHKLIESQTDGSGFHRVNGVIQRMDTHRQNERFKDVHTFVVTHDWGAVFADHIHEIDTEFRLPFPKCAFEFKISGLCLIALVEESPSLGEKKPMKLYANVLKDMWADFVPRGPDAADKFHHVEAQIVAICIALEAEVAESDVVRAPHKLNEKRERSGKLPLSDYHVVSLARRHHRASDSANPPDSGRRVRMHFRRGHWRHYDHIPMKWIKWMLVGNPDLGFINKHYKL